MRIDALVSFMLLLSATAPAYAYIDPNSGGLLFQILAPLMAVLAASVGFARRRLSLAWLMLVTAGRNLVARIFRSQGREIE
jgi:hypothetical protein